MKYKKIIRRVLFTVFAVIIVSFFVFDKTDTTTLEQQTYYHETLQRLDTTRFVCGESDDIVRAGWSKANITPTTSARVVGFGFQFNFKEVLDSVYVKTLVLQQGNKRFAVISYDLLIVHPLLKERLESYLLEKNTVFDGIYYGATHTHNSFGGWADGAVGALLLGGYDEKIINFVVEQTYGSLLNSMNTLDPVTTGYTRINLSDMILNRLTWDTEKDDWMRCIAFSNTKNEKLFLTSFSAHATCLFSEMGNDLISRDYPGQFADEVSFLLDSVKNKSEVMFLAGGVASHNPILNNSSRDGMRDYGTQLANRVIDSLTQITFEETKKIAFLSCNMNLNLPHFRISQGVRLRPWVFHLLFGKSTPEMQCLVVGNQIMVNAPCDFSGQITKRIEGDIDYKWMLTSFNGDYIGYITPDEYYDLDKRETRTMNWYGQNNGAYFQKLYTNMLHKATFFINDSTSCQN